MSAIEEDDYAIVAVVRRDVKMDKGKTCAQTGHAFVNCALVAMEQDPAALKAWTDTMYKKVVLRVDSLDELLAVGERAQQAGLINSLIMDAGLTQIPEGTVTCLGVGPAKKKDLAPITGHLKLLG